MKKCCGKTVTTYIVCTAHEFCGEQHGEDFARKMLNEAGIKMANKKDAEIIKSLGQQYVDTVNRLTS
ncbi:hypothetical protein D5E87_21850 [Vibrio parahaemolyticus]|uniref:hypothetical protein n=1 Tax=Vibrio harveyi group TaxID=717610 RepID=UPI0003ED8BCF|nr:MULTISPECIES: hypothetical protein [Vibrio harveyi group]AHJ02699.1 hypothetical protein VPUCM_p0022 [Vibrio parahaemolyticus UCM-V493]APX10185.1 hypothetical protein BWP24_28755 [Vibrio campbellii]EGQ8101412.1 hypothetical protein [Vibrio parahaemolyticus]EGQ9132696.1 hypothetical protein [Vibrio parahaemolyticus]EGR1582773.1 hypothetical protein [Vibrio parahaemolyticus]